MFKKVLSASLCMLLLFLFNFSCIGAKSYEKNKKSDSPNVIVMHTTERDIEVSKKEIEKTCKEQIKNSESKKDSKSSSQKWANVLNHPFRIVLRAGAWGLLGSILGGLLFRSNAFVCISAALCALCGGATKVIDYYNE